MSWKQGRSKSAMLDLPPGKWSALLVGAWWTVMPTEVQAAVAHWSTLRFDLQTAGPMARQWFTRLTDVSDRRNELGFPLLAGRQ